MFRSAMFAVLAIALSSSPSFARQVAVADRAEGAIEPVANAGVINSLGLDSIRRTMAANAVELDPIAGQSLRQQLTAAASASLVLSTEAARSASSASGLVAFAGTIAAEPGAAAPRNAPWWATTLAVAGPIADGLSTVYAIRQSGPHARVMEGNGLYSKMFGADVKPGEILAFKMAQAALMGSAVHFGGQHSRPMAIGAAVAQAAINFFVASQNMRGAATAKRLNAGAR